MAMPSQPFTFRLPHTFAKEVEQRAKAANKSPGTWVRQLVFATLNEVTPNAGSQPSDLTVAAQPLAEDTLGCIKEAVEDCLNRFFHDGGSPSFEISGDRQSVPAKSLELADRIGAIEQSLKQIDQALTAFETRCRPLMAVPQAIQATNKSLDKIHKKLNGLRTIAEKRWETFLDCDGVNWNQLLVVFRAVESLRHDLSLSVMALLTESGQMTAAEAGEWVGKFLLQDAGER